MRRPVARGVVARPASASGAPERTTWPGALSLATLTSWRAAIAAACAGVAPSSDEHRAAAGLLAGDRHEQAAQDDEPQAVALVERAGGDERGRARRASGRRSATGSTWSRTRSQPASDAQKIAGCAKRVDSSTRANGSSPTSGVTCCEQVGADGRDELAHRGLLAALAGEQDCGGGGFEHAFTVALVALG